MSSPQAFTFNRDAKYHTGVLNAPGALQTSIIGGPRDIWCSTTEMFTARVPDITSKYLLPHVTSDDIVDVWSTDQMQFWQNQLNFAVWCSTTGCGISSKNHLSLSGLSGSLYHFHAYYQVRRILAEIRVALPSDQAWSAFNNAYDCRAYERICNEFGVSPHTDWRIKGKNNGLGDVYLYYGSGYHVLLDGTYYRSTVSHVAIRQSFTETTTNNVLHIDYIAQDPGSCSKAWQTFILDNSVGYTQAGVERLNESIRVYVWAVLGAQAQTRTIIVGTGTAFDAQKQFLANLEDAISHPVDLPSAIEKYQNVLQYARSKLDYVFGIGLYMAPSDMLLRIGQIEGFNNEIQVATADMKLGVNDHVNSAPLPPPALPDSRHHEDTAPSLVSPTTTVAEKAAADQHKDEKTALIVGGVVLGLLTLWACRQL